MPQAKPKAAIKPAAKPITPAPTEPTPAPTEPTPAPEGRPDTFKVKNTGTRKLSLTKGTIKPDKVGIATNAEYSTLYKTMEIV